MYLSAKSHNDIPDLDLPDQFKGDAVLSFLNSYDTSLQTDYVVSRSLVYMNTQD